MTPARVRLLTSYPQPRATTNPYIVMLDRALRAHPDLDVRSFSWRAALLHRYDVFHVHWPEILVQDDTLAKRGVRQLLFALLLLRLRCTRAVVVQTFHNLAPHERPPAVSRLLLAALRRSVRGWVTLTGEAPDGVPPARVTTVPHGHYADWFHGIPHESAQPGAFAYVGLIRDYKNVPLLVTSFRDIASSDVRLVVAGAPRGDALEGAVRSAAGEDPRVSLELRYLSDEELVRAVTQASVVVLPYADLHSSGTALAALSLRRPVLVPDGPVARALAAEVGPGWVLTFAAPLTGTGLVEAMRGATRALASRSAPDLSARDWSRAVDAHLGAYRRAMAAR